MGEAAKEPDVRSTEPFANEGGEVAVVEKKEDELMTSRFEALLGVGDDMPVEEAVGKEVSVAQLFRHTEGCDKGLLAGGIIGGLVLGSGMPLFSFFFGKIVNAASGDPKDVVDDINFWVTWLIVAGCIALVAGWANMTCFLMLGERQAAKIRELYFTNVLEQEPGWFDVQRSGALSSRLHGDTQIIHKGMGEKSALFWMHTSTVLVSYTVGFVSSWRLTLVLLAATPLLVVATGIMAWALGLSVTKSRDAYEKASTVVEDTLYGIRTVHAFAAHREKLQQFQAFIAEACAETQYVGLMQGLGAGVVMFVFFGTYAIGFLYASYLIDWEIHDIGDIISCFFSIVIGSFSLGQIPPPVAAFNEAKAAAYRVFAIIDRKPRILPGTKTLDALQGEISFNDLEFRYPTRVDNPVFKGLNLKVKAGSTVGLVGLSGCGKSTLISLVQRFYEPTAGYFARAVAKGAVDDRDAEAPVAKAYPYESNLTLLEAKERGEGKVVLSLPIIAGGTKSLEVEVDLAARTHRVLDGDGTVRCENGVWLWVHETLDEAAMKQRMADAKYDWEFRLPQDASATLNNAKAAGAATATIELAVGTFEIDLHAMTRRPVVSAVEFTPSGSVLVDGVPLGDLDVEWWRQQIGVVTQEPVLFVGTVLDNIRHGRPDATMEEVEAACQAANIDHVIDRWPDKYDTRVGEGGCALSGGQKQRIAIARAIIKQPKILILDEATSALDRSSELQVQRALDKLLSGTVTGHKPTTFIIAHRLQTVMAADEIVVMRAPATRDQGATIVEQGTHTALLEENGVYANLWTSQNRSKTAQGDAVGADAGPTETAAVEDDGPLKTLATYDEQAKEREAAKKELIEEKASLSRVAALAKPWSSWLVPGIFGSVVNGCVYPAYAWVFVHALDVFADMQLREDCDVVEAANRTACTAAVMDPNATAALNALPPQLSSLLANVTALACDGLAEANRTACDASNAKLDTRSDADFWVWMFVVIAVASAVGNILQFGAFGYMGEKLTEKIRNMLFEHLLRQDMGFFDQPDHEVGALSAMLSGEAQLVNQLFGPSIGMLLRIIVCLGTGFGISFYYSWKLSLVLLAAVPAMIVAGAVNVVLMTGFDVSGNTVAGRVTSEAITNIKTVVAFSMKAFMVETYSAAGAKELSGKTSRAWGLGFCYGFNQFAMFGTFALGMWYGGKLIEDDGESFRTIMIVVMQMTMSGMGVGESTAMQGAALDAKGAAANIFTVLDTEPAVDQMGVEGITGLSSSKIEFKDVSFTYPTRPDVEVLKKFNLTISPPAGGCLQTGLIGGTGSGKSTVIQLLQRFYSLPEGGGTIEVDGKNLASINLSYWRSQVGLVSQEPTLFQGSVIENIRLGAPEATYEEVVAAAKLAQIHETVAKLPNGYDTLVGTKGGMLSGGQKQRVAIARAVVKKPRFLLLDEATSALDNECERDVQMALDNIIEEGHMTTISIAHRLTTIRNADCITVLDKGVITEQGTHDELMKIENGDYRTRYELYHSLDAALRQ
eukprot:TRINITY_DN3119_c1_g1_i1.p1 TRINITY_DN3119_c1_g1~~TRINITY_DN3119_c1_g1_i1.p1  ORF type:complete len:1512 (+),score=605.35 TRINITY_DN3119_c1_g1_i1:52-4587(+)